MTEAGSAGRYAAVAQELSGTAFATIAYVEETDSTNADAAALLGDPRLGGRTIVAEYQRKGAGRKGRSWEAPPGTGLLFSTILPRTIASELLWLVPFWVALAVRDALLDCAITTTLQWPNDVLLGKRKLAGILCQSAVTGSAARVVCGVGINVHRQPSGSAHSDTIAFCDDVAHVERGELLRSVLLEYQRSLSFLDLPDRVSADWDSAAGLPGARYRIALDRGGEPFEATAQGLAGDGGLRVTRDDGRYETVSLADARVLR
jgi:BirA family transcriptional regulator, biotin operon repressor / biotin---[acetyl-CoA-carboxylase] ligase